MAWGYTGSPSQMVICPKCQARNVSGTRLCRQCGTLLSPQQTHSSRASAGNSTAHNSQLPFLGHPINPRPKIAYSPVKIWHKCVVFAVWISMLGLLSWLTLTRQKPTIQAVAVSSNFPLEPTPEVPTPIHIQTQNDSGQVVDFVIWPLYKNFPWVIGSDTEIENLGDVYNKPNDIFSPELRESIRQIPEVIAVGTADIRMKKDLRSEESLAASRTRTLEWLLNRIKGDALTVFAWNLGKWIAPPSQKVDYGDQRRVIVIGMKRQDKTVEFASALRKALESKKEEFPIFKQLLYSYSKSNDYDIR